MSKPSVPLSERDFIEAVLQTAEALVVVVDSSGRIVRFNRACVEATGYSFEQVKGRVVWDLLNTREERSAVRSLFLETVGGRYPNRFENDWVKKDGSHIRVAWANTALLGPQGEVAYVVATGIDVTHQKRIEEALRANERRLEMVTDALPALIAYVDRDGRYQFNNAGYERWFGIPKADLKGLRVRDLVGEEAYKEIGPHVEAALAGHPKSFEGQLPYERGGQRFIQVDYVPDRNDEGEVLGFYGLINDITARKQTEDALRASELFNRAVLRSLPAHVAVLDRNGEIVATNEAWDRFAGENGGSPGKTGVGCNYLAVCRESAAGDSDARDVLRAIQRALHGADSDFHLEYPCPSQTEQRWFLMSVSTLRADHGGCVVSHVDISARRLAEQALRESEARTRALLESASDGILAVDRDGTIRFCNRALERMFGYGRGELLGQSLNVLVPETTRPTHRKRMEEFFQKPASRPVGSGLPLFGVRKNGEVFPVEVGLGHFETEAGSHAVAFVSDVTEKRRAEEMLQARSNEIRRLVGGLLTAHEDEARRIARELHDDLGQDVATLAVRIGLLSRQPPASPAALQEDLRTLKTLTESLSDRVRDLSHQMHPALLEHLGLAYALESYCVETARASGVTIALRTQDEFPQVKGPPALCLYRIAQEALGNALRYSGASRVDVGLRRDGEYLSLTVSDLGRGFDPEGVRSKGGLGLISMEERAGLLGGDLAIESRLGEGARLEARIPWEGEG